ncbi:hypothetical protein JIX58_03340 [Brevundimonas diminuta]|uniref:hypothetical protein n=1 Tax=Brevundimonas diminuta TaxID=293 RepID=UPI001907F4E0|nr:hypothetical protein [Brevundimonas diminuta]MBK1974779.1 hypothetical protein [Brevundimonas diminuta]
MATSLPHYLRPPEEWTAATVTARDLVVWRDIVVSAFCEGCRVTREMNVWRIGARLADDHLQELRFRCATCGVYPSAIEISRRDGMAGQKLLMVPLRPRAWDDGHREDQARALQRAEARYKANLEREQKAWVRAESATRRE